MKSRRKKNERTLSAPPHFAPCPSLFRICVAMGSTLDLDKLLKLSLRLTMQELRAQQGSILLFDKTSDQLKMLASRGMPREITEKGYVPRKGSIAEWVISHDTPLLLNDVRRDSRFTSIVREREIRSSLCVPLRAQGNVIGTINITRTQRENFTDQDLDTLVILASQAALAIENARLHSENIHAARLAAIGRTVAAISHSTKNILTGLKGGVGIIEMGCQKNDWHLVEQGWQLVKSGTDRVTQLAHDMLNYSKEHTPERAIVDLPRLVYEVFAGFGQMAQEARIRLITKIEEPCSAIYADSTLLYHALLNLVTNAVEAIRDGSSRDSSFKGGEVEVGVERVDADSPAGSSLVRRYLPRARGPFDLIHVRDTGPGIPPPQLAHLFQPFSSFKGSKGTGLGLAVTQKIAREHGGDVAVESVVGQGTVFTIILPVIAPPTERTAKTKPKSKAAR
jgi:signal transduction histidine kinase